jgi:hypothetical protein
MLISCKSEPSLQEYFVEKTENPDFVALDISPSILNLNKSELTVEQNEALETFEKMNVLAFKADGTNAKEYEAEKAKVTEILKSKKYEELMHFGSGSDGASVSFIGDENNIEEFILFANSKENGFAVVRVLGEDMSPTSIATLMGILQSSNLDVKQLEPLQQMFNKNL